jgi:hypothetical protein
MADEDFAESEGPFAATTGNLAVLRDEAAALLRAASADPLRAAGYRQRAAWLGRMVERMERRIEAT